MIIFFDMNVGAFIGLVVACVLGGGIIGFLLARYFLKKQIEKNPPINEKMIRVMFKQMGRNPSEKQVREIMRNMNKER